MECKLDWRTVIPWISVFCEEYFHADWFSEELVSELNQCCPRCALGLEPWQPTLIVSFHSCSVPAWPQNPWQSIFPPLKYIWCVFCTLHPWNKKLITWGQTLLELDSQKVFAAVHAGQVMRFPALHLLMFLHLILLQWRSTTIASEKYHDDWIEFSREACNLLSNEIKR